MDIFPSMSYNITNRVILFYIKNNLTTDFFGFFSTQVCINTFFYKSDTMIFKFTTIHVSVTSLNQLNFILIHFQ